MHTGRHHRETNSNETRRAGTEQQMKEASYWECAVDSWPRADDVHGERAAAIEISLLLNFSFDDRLIESDYSVLAFLYVFFLPCLSQS
jgi:hypothetical protein